MINKPKASVFIIMIFFLILISCSNNKPHSEIKINKSKDTVAVDEIFIASLHLDNYKNRLPEFFIVNNPDTFRLLFNDTIKSAYFRATCHKAGDKIYKGFAQYLDSLGNSKRENFEITFVVK